MSIHKIDEQLYKVRWREGGRNRSLTVHGPLQLAEKIERKKMSLRDENRHLDIKKEINYPMSALIDRYEREYSAKKKSSARERSVLSDMRDRLGKKFAREVQGADLQAWYISLTEERHLQQNTALRHWTIARHVMKKASTVWRLETGLDRNPADDVEVVRVDDRRERFLSADEIKRLKKALDARLLIRGTNKINRTYHRLRILVLIALTTGMRISEIFNLKWCDVMWQEKLIAVTAKLKGGSFRYVPLTDQLKLELMGYAKTSDWMFPSNAQSQSVVNSWRTTLRDAKIEDFRFHDLRHTFASWYMMNGGDLYELAKILGHANIKMTERYAKLAKAYIAKTGGVAGEIWGMISPKGGE